MTSNRPFFSNFLTAFRAHSALKSAANTSVSTSGSSLAPQTTHLTTTTSQSLSSQPSARSTTTKSPSTLAAATAAVAAFSLPNPSHHHPRHSPTSPVHRGTTSPLSSGNFTNRRGSDSSSDGGYRETLGGEKWFIGGRTAQGDERYHRLGMVRRDRSGDRDSCDRMSL
jgi:hypothetical protein